MCWAAAPLRFRQTLFIVASPKTLNLFATFAQPCWMWIASCAWSVRVVWGHAMCGVHWICCSFFWLCNWCVFTACVQLWFLGEFSFVCFVIAIVARSTIWLPHSDSQPAFVHAAQNLRQCKRHRSSVPAFSPEQAWPTRFRPLSFVDAVSGGQAIPSTCNLYPCISPTPCLRQTV